MIITKEFLKNESQKRNITSFSQRSILNENLITKSTNQNYDIFISHSFLDKELVLTLVELFNEAGYSVYVDWIEDTELDRTNVTKKTADLVRSRISQSKSLAYIVTANISNSKWCPWELGFADGKLGNRAAILPILDDNRNFNGQEYLSLYPHIDYVKGTNEILDFWVNDPSTDNTYVTLREWINGKQPYYRKN
ncbi:toll/interleukin-1 receptor domain-containing protein [Vagococcus fluvialis]|uniref:toll/interleukin-1 receptor domain-containing protein n=1 Tax=Vagococcus fluvialis TaxID=2738 RepID=UPI001A8DB495|nr:toll/interleukin-1 receptor domain-containing protein [Vagococcus fluvialis]MBO0486577.1 toll/interleukin-1 receptor domain-containing protein [Vagococcus fluvialis]